MPAISSSVSSSSPALCLYDAIIVGAGPAGIATARTILSLSPTASILILEGRQRIGGRTLTSHELGVPVDLGASWIHHYSPKNPIVPLAIQTLRDKLNMTDRRYKQLVDSSAAVSTATAPAVSPEPDGEEVPVMATACYCGFVDTVDADGRAVRVPSPFPGLGGGEGRFALFDSDGSRVPHELYSEAVRIYNRLMRDAEHHGNKLDAALPPPPHLTFPHSPPLTMAQLSDNYRHYCEAVSAVDTSVLDFVSPSLAALPSALRRCVEFLLSGAEQFEGASLSSLSTLYWQDGSDGSGEVECDMLVQRGYGDLIRDLGHGLPTRTGRVVTQVDYDGPEGVTVEADVEEGPEGREKVVRHETYHSRAVVVTVPLGCLKRNAITFHPALPPSKLHAIASFGFGLMNKIVLQFDRCWWGDELISIGWCGQRRGQYRWLLSLRQALALNDAVLAEYDEHKYADGLGGSHNILVCFSTADAGWDVEASRSDEQQKEDVMAILRAAFTNSAINSLSPSSSSASPPVSSSSLTPDTVVGTSRELLYTGRLPSVSAVPEPSAFLVTRWGSDRFCYGSYSHYALGSNELTVQVLAAAVGDGRIGFAGEHTSSGSLGCVDSAWETGMREGKRVVDLLGSKHAEQQAAPDSPQCAQVAA